MFNLKKLQFSVIFIALLNFRPSYQELTSFEASRLRHFKKLVASSLPHDYMKEDDYLITWLKARNFVVVDAREMLLKNLEWRKLNQMDGILDEDWSDFNQKYKYSIEGCDKEGHPVVSIPVGGWNVRAAVLSGKSMRMMRYFDKYMEEMTSFVRRARANGQNISSHYVEIFDLENYKLLEQGCPLCAPIYMYQFSSYENHYPDTTIRSWLINAPPIFIPLWTILNPLMSKKTRETVFLYGRNEGSLWMEHMNQFIDKSQLTKKFGGFKDMPLDMASIRKQVNGTFQC